MASSTFLKSLFPSILITKSLSPARPVVTAASRLFNTNAAPAYESDDDYRTSEVYRNVNGRRDLPPNPFTDVFIPMSSKRSLSQILNMMDEYEDSTGAGAGVRRGWKARETVDGLYLSMDMPGLGKENVEVSVEQNFLTIKGQGEKESENEDRRYLTKIELPEKVLKMGEIKAEMKNGVLKVVVPKVKEEERTDVFHVKVD